MHGRWAWSQLNREWRVCDWRAEKQAVQDEGCKAGSTLKRALQTPRQGVSFTAKWSGKLQVYKQRSALIYDLKTVICLLHGKRNMGGEQNGWAILYQEYHNWDMNSEAAQRSSARDRGGKAELQSLLTPEVHISHTHKVMCFVPDWFLPV